MRSPFEIHRSNRPVELKKKNFKKVLLIIVYIKNVISKNNNDF